MSLDYGAGSLATLLIDTHENKPFEFNFEAIPVNYDEYIRSAAWKEKADAAKARAGHRCQICYGTHRLQAHHRTYIRLGHELPTDITVLCDTCHGKVSPKREEPCSIQPPF